MSSPAVREPFTLRPAHLEEIAALEELIACAARELSRGHYTSAQTEAAIAQIFGVDSELVGDGTYYAAEQVGTLIGCGGWSRRATLFGGDRHADRDSRLLDPAREPARIRAFFVHPTWARRGVGRALLDRCEAEAQARGFRALALMATLPGALLYRACGYVEEERVTHVLSDDVTIDFIAMRKQLR